MGGELRHLFGRDPGARRARTRARARALIAVGLAALLACAALAPAAWADGDPGSDVLVYQDLFVAADAGLSVAQQAQFGTQLQGAAKAGFPVRVAIISSPSDLGAVTQLWQRPRAYAQFLGIELSLAYKQRLLVVMPNGFGFNWPGHATAPAYRVLDQITIGRGGAGLLTAAQTAVRSLAASGGVRLGGAAAAGAGPAGSAAAASAAGAATGAGAAPVIVSGGSSSSSGQSTDNTVAEIALAVLVLAGVAFAVRRTRRRRRVAADLAGAGSTAARPQRRTLLARRQLLPGFALLFGVAALTPVVVLAALRATTTSTTSALQTNPHVDPGTTVARPAADFTLSDQFGKPVSLRSFRGKVVMLAFTDSECTTICPMTTAAMLNAKAMLGAAARHVALLGVDANPSSTSLEDVLSYSELHGMLHQWQFLTGSLPQLRRVWKSYAVYADIQRGLIAHTPALFMIGPDGRAAKVYITQQSYSAVGQFSQVLAREASNLLPGHPAVHSHLSYAPVPTIGPATTVSLPRSGGGRVTLGPGQRPRLYVFFATWDQEITSLAGNLDALNAYQASASAGTLPAVTAVDEGTVEPSPAALPQFLAGLPRPLSYPVAIDATGRVADGYEVLGEPWFVLTSPSGRILWYWEVSTSGWPSPSALAQHVRAALARAPAAPSSAAAIAKDLAGSPSVLAALHAQASRLLGSGSALDVRIRALRGHPIVINAWASWCTACRSEFGLFALASGLYGRRVAFLGADTDDSPGDAQAFLTGHPVSYPSYQTNTSDLSSLAAIEGLPTTIFLNAQGKVVFVHTGQYDSEGALDGDINSYALG